MSLRITLTLELPDDVTPDDYAEALRAEANEWGASMHRTITSDKELGEPTPVADEHTGEYRIDRLV
ncbi:hypothetical protein ACFVAJ_17140 [Agromyces sp. NPDC057679]|uniref:hypothetical protein n=1 Tax=Agromyces sp. NPDC057679 TaxID=3346207 RepID=UPI00366E8477